MSEYFLVSERLGFRHWTAEDLPLALALWTDPGVTAFLDGPWTPAQAEARLALEIDRQRTLGVQYWPVFELATGRHAGCAGLKPYGSEPGVWELGVHLARPFWSGRYGEEAARAVMEYGFQVVQARALMAGHHARHEASKALMDRLGFRFDHIEEWGPTRRLCPFYRLDAVIEQ